MHWALIHSPFFNFHFIMHFLNFFLFLPVFFTFFAARTCFFLFPLTPIVVVYSSWGSVFLKVSSFYRAALPSFLNMAHRGPSDNVASSSVLPGFSWLKIVIWGGGHGLLMIGLPISESVLPEGPTLVSTRWGDNSNPLAFYSWGVRMVKDRFGFLFMFSHNCGNKYK